MSDFAKDTNVPANDCISRQAAIDALAELQGRAYTKAELKGISKAWKRIKQLPSAQPYTDAELQKMQELEQAELQKAYECGRASAQPEIIHCRECKHYSFADNRCDEDESRWLPDSFCSFAERREE